MVHLDPPYTKYSLNIGERIEISITLWLFNIAMENHHF